MLWVFLKKKSFRLNSECTLEGTVFGCYPDCLGHAGELNLLKINLTSLCFENTSVCIETAIPDSTILP